MRPSRPLVVFIHGGYWRSLHPSMFSHWAGGANAHGYAVALLGYRLCPEVGVADIVADVRAALLFISTGSFGNRARRYAAIRRAATLPRRWSPPTGAQLRRRRARRSCPLTAWPSRACSTCSRSSKTSINETFGSTPMRRKALSPAFWPAPARR